MAEDSEAVKNKSTLSIFLKRTHVTCKCALELDARIEILVMHCNIILKDGHYPKRKEKILDITHFWVTLIRTK